MKLLPVSNKSMTNGCGLFPPLLCHRDIRHGPWLRCTVWRLPPSTHHSLFIVLVGDDESELYQKPGHATHIHNEITPTMKSHRHGDEPKGKNQRSHTARCSQKRTVISETSCISCSVTAQRRLTCRCSTGLSQSSCSSLLSMSESSWSRNTITLQYLFHGFSTLTAGV